MSVQNYGQNTSVMPMSDKTKLFYRLLSIIGAVLLIVGLLHRHAADSNVNMFSIKNIVGVGLIILIGILIAILAKKKFKDKFDIPMIMLLKKIFYKKN